MGKRLIQKTKKEFSKLLLVQESILIWIITLSFIKLAFICIQEQYLGSLPWLAAMVSFPWAAYGVSQAFYYTKSKAENTEKGIKYQSAMMEMVQKQKEQISHNPTFVYQNPPDQSGNIDIDAPI